MKVLYIDGKLKLRLAESEVPEPTEHQVRIRPAYVGICGSDLHYFFEGANGAFVVQEPLIPGHELSAIVDFDPVGQYAQGQLVTVHPATFGTPLPGLEDRPNIWPNGAYLGSASTWPHTQGAAVEFMVLDRHMLRALPKNLDLRAASLAEPLAVGLHAISLAGGVQGKSVLVSGAGPIGLLNAAAAVLLGASHVAVTDVLNAPLARAVALGVNEVIRVPDEDVPAERFDLVFECSASAAALSTALTAVRRAGTVVQVGMFGATPISLAIAPLVSKEIRLLGTFRFAQEIDAAIELLAQHPEISSVITHVFPLADATAAFEAAKNPQESGKVLLKVLQESANE